MRVLRFELKSSQMLGLGIGLLLLLALACGAVATATPAPPTTSGPAPTAMPQATPSTGVPVVNPGKVTWMIGSFGNERFDNVFTAGGGRDYAQLMHAFLISSDVKDGRRVVIPGIATKWEVSSDGLTWTLTIRKGVKFHDGTEVTAEDVLWNLRHSMSPEAKAYAISPTTAALAPLMDRIEQTGPDRVNVTTKVPLSDFPGTISEATGPWIGTIIPKRATLHDENEEAAYDRKPVGAGIMRLVKHVPLETMTFERFADYYHQPKNGLPTDKRVNFTQLDLQVVPEEATRVAALRAGDADIAPVSMGARKQIEAGGGRVVLGQEGVAFYILQLGCWKPQFPCRDKRVRQALTYAINKELIRDHLYGGPEVMQLKGWYVVTPSTIGYSPEVDPFPFDPVKARQLLADAGYPGGKGFGKLVINTWVSTAMPFLPESAQAAADSWRRELGLDVEVKLHDIAALKKATKVSEDYFGQIYWREQETRLDAAGTLRATYGTPGVYERGHEDPELFALMDKSLAVFDPAEREKTLKSTYRRLRDEAYDLSFGYINIPWGVGPRIQTWQPYPLAFYPSALHTINLK